MGKKIRCVYKKAESVSKAQWSTKSPRGSNPNTNGFGAPFYFAFFVHGKKETDKKAEKYFLKINPLFTKQLLFGTKIENQN